MIVRKEIKTGIGRYGGRYMEDRPEFDERIYCDRCGKQKPNGRDGLGWYEADGEQVNSCPECLETDEEYRVVSYRLQQYIHHSIWARGSKIGIALRTIGAEQVNLAKDCARVKELLSVLNPSNKESLLNKIEQAIKSAGLKYENTI